MLIIRQWVKFTNILAHAPPKKVPDMKKTLEVWPPEKKQPRYAAHFEPAPGHFALKSRPVRILLLILLCILFFTGCSVKDRVDVSFSDKPAYYMDAYVTRGKPEIHVYPLTDVGGIKVIFVPFKVVQKMDNPEMVGYSLARGFWQTWASMEVFDQFEFFAEAGPFRRDLAIAYARSRGADMVVGGFVTHIFAGGNSSDNRLSLQIEAYDVGSGLLVWSMAQGGVLPAPKTRDYIIFATKRQLSTDPMQLLNSTLAHDMGTIMKEWTMREPNYDEFGQIENEAAKGEKKK